MKPGDDAATPEMDTANLYRDETFTDRRVGTSGSPLRTVYKNCYACTGRYARKIWHPAIVRLRFAMPGKDSKHYGETKCEAVVLLPGFAMDGISALNTTTRNETATTGANSQSAGGSEVM